MSHSTPNIAMLIGVIAFVLMVVYAIRSPRKVLTGLMGIFAIMLLCALALPFFFLARTNVQYTHRDRLADSLERAESQLDRVRDTSHRFQRAFSFDTGHGGSDNQSSRSGGQVVIHDQDDKMVIDTTSGVTTVLRRGSDVRDLPAADDHDGQQDKVATVVRANIDTAVEADMNTAAEAPTAPAPPPTPEVISTISAVTSEDAKKRGIDDPFAPESPVVTESSDESESGDSADMAQDATDEPEIETSKPDWIYDSLSTGQEPHRLTVRCGPFQSQQEVEQRMDQALQAGAQKYAAWYLNSRGKQIQNLGGAIRLRMPNERLHECVADQFNDLHVSDVPGVEPMPVRYVLMEFDDDFRRQVIDVFWRQSVSVGRAIQVGLGGVGLFSLLGVVFGAVKFDSLTRGQHRKKVVASAGLIVTATLLTCTVCGLYFVQS